MPKSDIETLHKVLTHFRIDGNTLYFGSHRLHSVQAMLEQPDQALELLFKFLYYHGYSLGDDFDQPDPNPVTADLPKEKLSAEYLMQFNSGTERWDPFWTVEEVNPDQTVILRKQDHQRLAGPGDYYLQDQSMYTPVKGAPAVLHRKKGYHNEAFYFVHSDHPCSLDDKRCIRLYFNINPQGLPSLIQFLTQTLNRANLPFQFKCFIVRESYQRADTAVLYLEKQHFDLAWYLIESGYTTLEPYLRKARPWFTHQLKKGISFAEDPGAHGESFGTIRARTLGKLILNYLKSGSKVENWPKQAQGDLKRMGFNPDHLCLNPGSVYPYPFIN